MTLTDPIADMLTRIRNANMARKDYVDIPASKIKVAIARTMKDEGYVKYYKVIRDKKQGILRVFLKYGANNEPIIHGLNRVSKPGIRKYVSKDEIPNVLGGMGVSIISTSRGVLTGRECKRAKIGGELLCNIW
jgi:small subunit ribosomal protein S8